MQIRFAAWPDHWAINMGSGFKLNESLERDAANSRAPQLLVSPPIVVREVCESL